MELDLPRAARARLDPAERYGLRLTLVGLAIVLVAVPFSTLTFQVLDEGGLTRVDGRVADALNRWVQGRAGAVGLLEAISLLGKPIVLAAVVAVVVVWLWRVPRRRAAIFLVATSLGGGLVSTAVKVAVDRPRPAVDHPVATAFGKSFPSGHALGSAVTYGAIVVALWPVLSPRLRRAGLALAVLAALAIGSSRLLLGLHFVTDVVGGYVLGVAWLSAAAAVFAVWREEAVVDQIVTGIYDPEPP